MYSKDQIQIAIDHFIRTWLKARNVIDYRLAHVGPLTHVAYAHAPVLTSLSRLHEFLVLQDNPKDNVTLIHSTIASLPHWLTVFTPDLKASKREYKALGYDFVSDEFLMRLPNLTGQLYSPNPDVKVERVSTVAVGEWLNLESRQAIVHPNLLTDRDVAYYFIRRGDVPACYGRYSVIDDKIIGPDKIQTHPAYRRQGLAFELLGVMHRDGAALGCTESVLLSSVEGRRLYHRLGYEDVSAAVVFASN